MTWQSTPWAEPLLAATVVSGSLAVFGLLYVTLVRRDRRVAAYATLMIGAAVWTLGYSFQFASATLAGKLRWATVAMAGEVVVPAACFTFALAYARRDRWLERDRLALLWVVPVATLVLVVTNDVHGLVWSGAALADAPDGSYLILDRSGGPWLFVHGAYSYLAALGGIFVVVGLLGRSRHVYRGQALVLLAGIMVTVAAHLVSLRGIGPTGVVDLTPPSLAVLGVAFAVGIFRYRLLELVPVARSSVVENMGEGYVLLDEADRVIDFNAAARSLLDGDERLIGRRVHDRLGADLSVLDSFEGGTETETVRVGGTADPRYLELTVSSVGTGTVTGRLLKVRDVTDRARLRRRFRTLIERSSDVVFLLDETGVIEYASPSVRRVLGYDPGTLVGDRTFESLTVGDVHRIESVRETATGEMPAEAAPERRTAATETWYRILGKQEGADADTVRFEVALRTDDGSERTIEAYARYLVDDPAVEGIVINARDVTERRERERELERTNERLDRFASAVSHDLRNPLGVASGYLELAAEGDTDAIDEVRKQHDRMETMIADLLTMARDGGEIADDELAEVSLEAAARRAWRNVDTGGADLVVDGSGPLLAAESRLSNLLENLFRNAVEHGSTSSRTEADDAVEHGTDPEAGVDSGDLTVTVERVPDGFAVSDDGVGIPEEHRGQVFESGHTTEPDNTGFGLAIVDEIASAHGWTAVAAESADGGARFEIRDVDRPADRSAADRPDPPAGEVE